MDEINNIHMCDSYYDDYTVSLDDFAKEIRITEIELFKASLEVLEVGVGDEVYGILSDNAIFKHSTPISNKKHTYSIVVEDVVIPYTNNDLFENGDRDVVRIFNGDVGISWGNLKNSDHCIKETNADHTHAGGGDDDINDNTIIADDENDDHNDPNESVQLTVMSDQADIFKKDSKIYEDDDDVSVDDDKANLNKEEVKKSIEDYRILTWNINTFKNERIPFIYEVLEEYKPDVICINESGINPNAIHYPEITNFTLTGACNKKHSNGFKGGVLLYVANYLVHKVISIPVTRDFKDCQVIGFQINDINFYSIYRSPSQTRDDFEIFCSWLEHLDDTTTYIFGDLNIRADWNSYVPEKKKETRFMEFLIDNGYKQFVNDFTYMRSKSVLDIVLANDHSDLKGVIVVQLEVDEFPCIDHRPVIFVIDGSVELQSGKKFKPIKNIKKKEYEEACDNHNWQHLIMSNDIDYIAENLVKELREIYFDNVPEYHINPNKIKKYDGFSAKTKKLFVKRKKARKKGDKGYLKKTQKEFKKLVREDKMRKSLELANKMDKDKNLVWKLTKDGKTVKGKKMGLENKEGVLVFEEQEKADIMMEHFSNNETEKTYKTVDTDIINDKARITDVVFTNEKIAKRLKKAKSSWALAPDESFTNLFKFAGSSIIWILVVLFTLVMDKGKLALIWLTSKITVIEKKGDLSKVNSWRPLKIQAYLLRLFESVLAEEIFEVLERADFFWHQYAYRIGISTVDNLLDYWIHLNEHMDRGFSMSTLYLDLKAAFDRTSHGHLIDIFYNEAGVQGKLIRIIEAWLSNRKHYVKLGSAKSMTLPVKSGNQQGSSIGPLAYNIYCQFVLNKCRQWGEELEIEGFGIYCFADDTKVTWANTEDNKRKIQIFLDKLVALFDELHLSPNVAKCKILHFTPNNNPCWDFKLGNNVLNVCNEETDLGLITRNNMAFDEMAKTCEKNANNAAKLVRKVARISKYSTKKQLWYGQIASRITYASPIWRNKKFEDKFRKIYVNYWKYFRIPKWDTPPRTPTQEFVYHDLIMIFRIFNNLSPIKSEHFFRPINRTTRLSQSLLIHSAKPFKKWKESLLERNLKFWNEIPSTYKTTHSLNIFKNYIKKNILPSIDKDLLDDLISGDLRRRHMKKDAIAKKEAKRRDFCIEQGLPGNTVLGNKFDFPLSEEESGLAPNKNEILEHLSVGNTETSSDDDDYIPNEPLCLRANLHKKSKKAKYIRKHFPKNPLASKFERYQQSQCNCNNEACKKDLAHYNFLYPQEPIDFSKNIFC